MIEKIAGHFGNLTVSRGKKHKFLGMDVEFSADGKLSLFMKDCIEESIGFFGEELSANVSSPAKNGLQNIYESSPIPEKKNADILHSIVAKILWVEKVVMPNIEPDISLLRTRVTNITKEERAKLRRLFQYLKYTIYDKNIMGEDSLNNFFT